MYARHRARLQCQQAIGWGVVLLLWSLLSVFLLGFGHVVSLKMQKQWISGSGASVAIDLVAFELLPALVLGSVVVSVLFCSCRCCLWLLVLLDVYRVFRNLAA